MPTEGEAGHPGSRGFRKCWPDWTWRQQAQCAQPDVPIDSPSFSYLFLTCFWAGPMSGTWGFRPESTWVPGARCSLDLSYSLLCPQGLEGCLAPSKHGGVVSAVTGGRGSLRDSVKLTLCLGGVELEGAGPDQDVKKAAGPVREAAGEGRCFRSGRSRPGLG